MPTIYQQAMFIFAALLLQACLLGEQPPTQSPYDTAFFSVSAETQIADGISPIIVQVHGSPGSTLTLQVANALFISGEEDEFPNEKTIQLVDTVGDGDGQAEVQIVATTPGLATLSFKLAPLAASVELAFRPLRVGLGAPEAMRMEPGAVLHQLCLYANTSQGTVRATSSSGSISPGQIELAEIESSSCKSDDPQWLGAASLQWSSRLDQSTVEVEFLGPEDQVLLRSVSEVRGQNFPGYWAALQGVELTPQWASVQAQIYYAESAALAESAAGSVLLHDLRSVPPGLRLVGSSSGTPIEAPQTDSEGLITLFFEMPDGNEPVSVFATPEGGGTLFLGEVSPSSNPEN